MHQLNFPHELFVKWAVATLGILSKVFLFLFEKISDNFSIFRDVLVNTGRNSKFGQHEVCALKKKKKNIKTKTNLHSVHQKILKEKKKNEQRYLYNKL